MRSYKFKNKPDMIKALSLSDGAFSVLSAAGEESPFPITVAELYKLIDCLPAKECYVMRGRLQGYFTTLEDAGHKLGCTRENVRRIEMSAIKHLKRLCNQMHQKTNYKNRVIKVNRDGFQSRKGTFKLLHAFASR